MHASEFARKRGKIERRAGGRAAFFRKAMLHLIHEASAVTIIIRGQLVGWRMTDGSVVCVKQRYREALDAQLELVRIMRYSRSAKVPVRAYPCQHCGGWHLTSQARGPGNDNNPERR